MKYIYIYIALLAFTFSKSQNLVPNNSFESFTICPNNGGQIESAIPWGAATTNSSTDYFNACSTNFNVPYYPSGYQVAKTGTAYAGFVFCSGTGQREYLQVHLISPLIQNKIYNAEFYVNLSSFNWSSGCNNIAANFSITQPFTSTFGVLQSLTPHIMNSGNPIINDTVNWVQISGCYIAQGGEQYLTIGNFFDNANTQVGVTGASYYFIDDVRVEEMTGTCVTGINELSNNYQIELYPNPANEILNLKIVDAGKDVEIKITDVLGRKVIVSEYKEQLNISQFEKGIYYLSVYKAHNLVGTKKIVKQ